MCLVEWIKMDSLLGKKERFSWSSSVKYRIEVTPGKVVISAIDSRKGREGIYLPKRN